MVRELERPDSKSLERIVPDDMLPRETTGEDTLRVHLERYQFARQSLVAGNLLDIACGVGYGTAVLCESPLITSAIGVDIDPGAVQYASLRYGTQRISYVCANAYQFSSNQQFRNIVSLETIEHVEDPQRLVTHFTELLAPGGRLIASVPVTPSVDGNPHHKSNFSEKSFRRIGHACCLAEVTSFHQVQPFCAWAIATRQEARTENIRTNLVRFYMANPCHLFLRVWSTVRDGFVNKYLTIVWEKR